jgi:hypothetical protein
MKEALSPFRDYEAPKPIEATRGSVSDCDLIAATTAIRIWSMKTHHPLEAVLAEGFFKNMCDLRFRRDDRIELLCDCDADRSSHATLLVEAADKHGHAAVSLLHLYGARQ